MTPPCKDCNERCIGCHGFCRLYLQYRVDKQAGKEAAHKDRGIMGIEAIRTKQIRRMAR